jgi:hypothetical protein
MRVWSINNITFYSHRRESEYFNSVSFYLSIGGLGRTGNRNDLVLSQLNLAADIDKEN